MVTLFGLTGVLPALLLVFIPLPTLRLLGTLLDTFGAFELFFLAILRVIQRILILM